jgi:hypothetical protein
VWGREEVSAGVWLGNVKERDQLENPSVDGRIILRWICTKWERRMDWSDLAQDKVR